MELDQKKVVPGAQPTGYRVDYIVYREDKGFDSKRTYQQLSDDILYKRVSGEVYSDRICFAQLRGQVHSRRNRILFKVTFAKEGAKGPHVDLLERKKWINLCVFHKLIPAYARRHFFKTGNLILRLEGITFNRLYVSLVAARYIQEYPSTVKSAIYLYSKGLPFLVAVLCATKATLYTQGHSLFGQVGSYCHKGNILEEKVDARDAFALSAYLHGNGPDADQTKIMEMPASEKGRYPAFSLHNTIGKIRTSDNSGVPANLEIQELFANNRVKEAVKKSRVKQKSA